MARTNANSSGRPLVIVESPAKARTIGKFLGQNYVIEASIGHIRDLPESKKQLPEKLQKEPWAYLGVDVDHDFEPVYVVSPERRDQVKKLQSLVKEASELYLATDEDREGEAISWHLVEVLKPKIPVRRMVFHEITREAIREALDNPRRIDDALVQAQETRRILDRLYGYDVSNLLWRKMGGIAKSAGRVQSVAVRMIVQREHERIAFRRATYWDLLGSFSRQNEPESNPFEATLVRVGERRLAAGKDFDPSTGRLKETGVLLLDEAAARQLVEGLQTSTFAVSRLEDNPYTSKPYAPFTTSTLQQEANRKLRFSAQRTMQVAQSLYQNGFITYMRTDSTVLSDEAIRAARELVQQQYGPAYLPEKPRVYANRVRNAQEAHEAIRPAGTRFRKPDEVRNELNSDELRLYELIWKRTVASQMTDARMRTIVIGVSGTASDGREVEFQTSGKTIDFPGYLRAYVEGSDDPQAQLADKETVLPQVEIGQQLDLRNLEPKSHTTQPPARYTEATLTRALEERGIGRPSTYASIMSTIVDRGYVSKRGNAMVPTWTAMAMVKLMETHLPNLVDFQFTARLEDDLDAISRGEAARTKYLQSFYYGADSDGLKHQVESKLGEIDVRAICRFYVGRPGDETARSLAPPPEETPDDVFVRVGKYGPFIEQGERRAPLRDDLAPDEVTVELALQSLQQAAQADEPLGVDPETGKPIFIKSGRFGPYVQRGAATDGEKPQMASLLRGMTPESVTLETALRLLSLPRELGPYPPSGELIVAQNGKFGPYLRSGTETRSLPEDISPLDVTLEQAIELLSQPKTTRRGFTAKPREPLKVLGPSPVTEQEVKLLEGRFGKYVTDGQTNATLPKGVAPEELTLNLALDLLATRAAMGPSKRRKKGARKKAGPAMTAAAKKKPSAGGAGKKAAKKSKKAKKAKKGAKKTAKKKKAAGEE